MSSADFRALVPILITACSGVLLMVVVAFWRNQKVAFALSLISLAAAFGSIFVALPEAPRAVTTLVQIDFYSLFFTGLILATTFLVTMFCPRYMPSHAKRGETLYVLVVFASLGMITLASSIHFVSFFLGLEILSVSLYGLIGYTRRHKQSLEGAVKYLILAATASAFLLFGIALVYFDTGTMDFRQLLMSSRFSTFSLFGFVLIMVAFGFKLAFVPFHMWSPDVYQGAPAPITALIATGSKGAVFALLLRLVSMTNLASNRQLLVIMTVLSIATMLGGNLLALLQTNVKRLLAYSSVAHMGYLLIPLISGGQAGSSSIVFYLVSYFATTVAVFGVISIISSLRESGDVDDLNDYRGLSRRNPILAAIFTLALLSLTGIPLTSGFIAKFYIFSAAAQSGLWLLLIVGVVASGISAFYYLRVIITMYSASDEDVQPFLVPSISSGIALAVSVSVIVFFGVYPSPLIRLAEAATKLISPH